MEIRDSNFLVKFYGPLQNVPIRNTDFVLGHTVIINKLSSGGSERQAEVQSVGTEQEAGDGAKTLIVSNTQNHSRAHKTSLF